MKSSLPKLFSKLIRFNLTVEILKRASVALFNRWSARSATSLLAFRNDREESLDELIRTKDALLATPKMEGR